MQLGVKLMKVNRARISRLNRVCIALDSRLNRADRARDRRDMCNTTTPLYYETTTPHTTIPLHNYIILLHYFTVAYFLLDHDRAAIN